MPEWITGNGRLYERLRGLVVQSRCRRVRPAHSGGRSRARRPPPSHEDRTRCMFMRRDGTHGSGPRWSSRLTDTSTPVRHTAAKGPPMRRLRRMQRAARLEKFRLARRPRRAHLARCRTSVDAVRHDSVRRHSDRAKPVPCQCSSGRHDTHVVRRELFIRRYDRDVESEGLRHEDPVERIAVMVGQLGRAQNVRVFDTERRGA